MIILIAALYAALFAWHELRGGIGLRILSLLAYGLLLSGINERRTAQWLAVESALALLNLGVAGMTVGLLIAGYEQSFIERAVEGSAWSGYFAAQNHPWSIQAMVWREVFGC